MFSFAHPSHTLLLSFRLSFTLRNTLCTLFFPSSEVVETLISTVFSLANEHETALVAAKAEKAGKEQAARGAEGEGGARAGPFRMRIVSDYVGSNYVGNVNDVGSAGRRDGRCSWKVFRAL